MLVQTRQIIKLELGVPGISGLYIRAFLTFKIVAIPQSVVRLVALRAVATKMKIEFKHCDEKEKNEAGGTECDQNVGSMICTHVNNKLDLLLVCTHEQDSGRHKCQGRHVLEGEDAAGRV